VKPEFATAAYGTSSLNDIKVNVPQPQGRQAAQAAPAPQATANALRIRGFWRENPKGQDAVSELLKSLREKSSSFRFSTKDAKSAEIPLTDERLLDITVAGKPGELGLPFVITLPLAREVVIK
jgi:hypothetical protein